MLRSSPLRFVLYGVLGIFFLLTLFFISVSQDIFFSPKDSASVSNLNEPIASDSSSFCLGSTCPSSLSCSATSWPEYEHPSNRERCIRCRNAAVSACSLICRYGQTDFSFEVCMNGAAGVHGCVERAFTRCYRNLPSVTDRTSYEPVRVFGEALER